MAPTVHELAVAGPPRGEVQAIRLIEAASREGDLCERHYLELKGSLDLTKARDREKVAKFVLGCANRSPEVASGALGGLGLMIIGVGAGVVTGIPRFEALEFERSLQRYLGAGGPAWDLMWVQTPAAADPVLFLLVDPPVSGQPPYVCRSSGETLQDGRIYIRADGETREINSSEFDQLLRRAAHPAAIAGSPVAVQVHGNFSSLSVSDDSILSTYVDGIAQDLLRRLEPGEKSALDSAHRPELFGLRGGGANLWLKPEPRDEAEYRAEISDWVSRTRAAWPTVVKSFAASRLGAVDITVQNLTETYFEGAALEIHVFGEFELLSPVREQADWESPTKFGVPRPPRPWGPINADPALKMPRVLESLYRATADDVALGALGSRCLELPEELLVECGPMEIRPLSMLRFTSGRTCLARSADALSREPEFRFTARGVHRMFAGAVQMCADEPVDLSAGLRGLLGLV